MFHVKQDDMFYHRREVPEQWQAALDRIVPVTDKVSRLMIVWQAGLSRVDTNTPDYEVQRWEIYEVLPKGIYPEELLGELNGPDPRQLGRFVEDTDVRENGRMMWESWCNVSRVQWDIWQETGCYAQRFWIIQGDQGGHPWTLSRTEKGFLKAMGVEYDTPLPGDLPYAEPDQRTWEAVAECDRLRKWRQTLDWDQRAVTKSEAGIWLVRDRDKEEDEWNERMLKWLTNSISDIVSDMPRTVVNKIMMGNDQAPRGLFDEGVNEEALDAKLTGAVERQIRDAL